MTGSRPQTPIREVLARFLGRPPPRERPGPERLEFAAFSVKSRGMNSGGDGIIRWRRVERLWPMLALAMLLAVSASPARAQLFSDHPPPVPPASVPDPGAAVSLAPPSGPGAGAPPPAAAVPSSLPPVLTQPSIAAVPPTPPGGAPGQAVLALSARYGKDMAPVNGGLVWRIFADRPDDTGTFKMIREDRNATPNLVLPPGNYVVHVAL